MTTPIHPTKSKQLRRLLAGQAPADFADWLDYLAIAALLAFSWQAEPVVFALFAVALGLPYVLVGFASVSSAFVIVSFGLIEILARSPQFALFLSGWFAIGISSALAVVPIRTVIQNETAPERIARVTALSEAANTVALLSSPFAGAAIASLFSVGDAFVAGGLLLAIIAATALIIDAKIRSKAL